MRVFLRIRHFICFIDYKITPKNRHFVQRRAFKSHLSKKYPGCWQLILFLLLVHCVALLCVLNPQSHGTNLCIFTECDTLQAKIFSNGLHLSYVMLRRCPLSFEPRTDNNDRPADDKRFNTICHRMVQNYFDFCEFVNQFDMGTRLFSCEESEEY
jgi:hypothetical protein